MKDNTDIAIIIDSFLTGYATKTYSFYLTSGGDILVIENIHKLTQPYLWYLLETREITSLCQITGDFNLLLDYTRLSEVGCNTNFTELDISISQRYYEKYYNLSFWSTEMGTYNHILGNGLNNSTNLLKIEGFALNPFFLTKKGVLVLLDTL